MVQEQKVLTFYQHIHLSRSKIISTDIFSNAMDTILRTRTKISNVFGLDVIQDSFSDKWIQTMVFAKVETTFHLDFLNFL